MYWLDESLRFIYAAAGVTVDFAAWRRTNSRSWVEPVANAASRGRQQRDEYNVGSP